MEVWCLCIYHDISGVGLCVRVYLILICLDYKYLQGVGFLVIKNN